MSSHRLIQSKREMEIVAEQLQFLSDQIVEKVRLFEWAREKEIWIIVETLRQMLTKDYRDLRRLCEWLGLTPVSFYMLNEKKEN